MPNPIAIRRQKLKDQLIIKTEKKNQQRHRITYVLSSVLVAGVIGLFIDALVLALCLTFQPETALNQSWFATVLMCIVGCGVGVVYGEYATDFYGSFLGNEGQYARVHGQEFAGFKFIRLALFTILVVWIMVLFSG